MNERYAEIVADRMAKLKSDFPGVVWSCESIGDPQWLVIPQLMRGKHGVTGAVTEGLNLAVMEILCSNVGLPCSLVVGQGAGFAMRIRDEQGLGSLALFPKPGDALDFARSFEQLVSARTDNYQAIAERSHRLFTEAVLPRRDWIAVEE